MARKIETLNDTEMATLNEYMELYGLETLEEALDIAISEGSVDSGDGGKKVFIPEGVKILKLFSGHQKSKEAKVNKALKRAKRPALFEEDSFYLGTTLPKDDNGDFILDECTTIDVGEEPEIIVVSTMYKAVRAAFDASGQPERTNFDSTLALDMYNTGQSKMLTPYGSVADVIKKLKAEYHDGKQGKTQEKVPAALKVKFKIVLFCLVKTVDGWEKAMLELTNRYDEKQNLLTEWNKRDVKDSNGNMILPIKYVNKLKVTGSDNFDNPIIQIVYDGTLLDAKGVKEISKDTYALNRSIREFISSSVSALAGSEKPTQTASDVDNDIDDEDDVPDF